MSVPAPGSMRHAPVPHAPPGSGELAWLTRTLWEGNGIEVHNGVPGSDAHVLDGLGVLPSASRPRLLVPLGDRRAAARALRDYPSSKSSVRVGTALLALAIRAGHGERVIRDRITLSTGAELRAGGLADVLLQEHLRVALARADARVAVTFNAGRPQKKPVLQVIGADGETIAYVKVGWNDLTRSLVAHEASVLSCMQHDRPREFSVPQLRAAGPWRELELLVISAAPDTYRWRRKRVLRRLPLAATRELARLGETSRTRLSASRFWRELKDALAAALPWSDDPVLAAPALQTLEAVEARHGETLLRMGLCHGDWVPWNMGETAGSLHVWDWERSNPHSPHGLDAVHFLFQVQLNLLGRHPAQAVSRTLAQAAPVLRELSVPERLAPVLLALHLLQMTLRLEQGRAGGIGGVIMGDLYAASLRALQAERTVPW
jgi:hypothetical protein